MPTGIDKGYKSVPDSVLLKFVEDIIEAAVESYLRQAKQGIMIHFDASLTDAGGLSWLRNKQFKLGYNRAYKDSGDVVKMVALNLRAPHAGACRTNDKIKDPNSAYYGLCALTNEKTKATSAQLLSMLEDSRRIYKWHMENSNPAWKIEEVSWRVRGHHEEGIYTKDHTSKSELWGKTGRKMDPYGIKPFAPVIDMNDFRLKLATALATGEKFK